MPGSLPLTAVADPAILINPMPRPEFVILSREASADGELVPLGSRAEIVDGLSHCNTGPEAPGEDLLYGPGLEILLPPGEDPIRQMILRISDDDIGYVVMLRMAKEFRWKVRDLEHGREFQP